MAGRRRLKQLAGAWLVLGAASAASSAGTFASFSASTTNGSAFAAGTIVLSSTVDSGTACLSTGTNATNNVDTDDGENATCPAPITLSAATPGDTDTAALTITNDGTLDAATGLRLYAPAACADSDTADLFHGTGSPCATVQTYVQATDSGGSPTACLYGKGASAVINGTPRTFPFVVGAGNRTFGMVVDGVAHPDLAIAAGSYSQAGLAAAINAVFGAWATAAVGPDNAVYLSSNTRGSGSSISVTPASSGPNFLNPLGLSGAGSHTGGQVTCQYDAVHSLTHFTTTFTSNANGIADFGALASGASRHVVVGASLPASAGNSLMGRQATWGYTFTATQ